MMMTKGGLTFYMLLLDDRLVVVPVSLLLYLIVPQIFSTIDCLPLLTSRRCH